MACWAIRLFPSCKCLGILCPRPLQADRFPVSLLLHRGVVTQDLTKVHAVNTVDKDERDAIHWKKYEVIADALGPISLYQSRQNPFATLPGSSAARQMIIDCPRLDEDVSKALMRARPHAF